MKDGFGREINYMRISVTDRCNLRCKYCMPAEGVEPISHENVMRFEEIERVVGCAVQLGITKYRLTGGEPLVRKGIVGLVENMAKIPGVQEIDLTTNGVLLGQYATDLKKAGLSRINVSLDTLDRDKYAEITRGGDLDRVAEGLAAAEAAGFTNLKLNVVSIAGFNDDEIQNFVQLTLNEPIEVRFIELMPLGNEKEMKDWRFLSNEEVRQKFAGAVEEQGHPGDVARFFRYPGAPGRIGLISPISKAFCGSCNKVRLTADGKLKPCLHSDREIDLKAALAQSSDEELLALLREAIFSKEEGHKILEGYRIRRDMNQIGG